MQTTTLYFREGASDKIYQVTLEERPDGWTVNFAFGRRGTTLSSGTKTQQPVSYNQALKIHDRLIREKTAKGYTPGEDATPYTGTDQKVTDVRPQLLNPVELAEVPRLLADDSFVLQPKFDGRRMLVQKKGQSVIGINRRGIECGIPDTIRVAALKLEGDFLIDGEAVGDTLHVFDLLERRGQDARSIPYRWRLEGLGNLVVSAHQIHIWLVDTYSGEEEKCYAFESYREQRMEGVVFKREVASYSAGRPASGGDQLKFKFVETASVVIKGINTRRSVAIAVWENGRLVSAGNVTIPADQPIPMPGDVAEVRYLYAMPGSGALFQPVYRGPRDDIAAAECTRDQLKFKAA